MPPERVEMIKNTIGMFFHVFGIMGIIILAAVAYVVITSEDGLNSSLLKQDNWYAYGVSLFSAIGLVVYRIKYGGIDWRAGLFLGLPTKRKDK